MKKLALLVVMAVFAITAYSQTEIKINPIGALFGSPDISAEFGINENFGVEAGVALELGKVPGSGVFADSLSQKKSGFGVFAAGKYYFSPDDGIDRFGIGMYLRAKNFKVKFKSGDVSYTRSVVGAGLMMQYKWVGASGVLFEVAGGAGRAFVDKWKFVDSSGGDSVPGLGVDVIARIALGYRFGM